MEERQYAKKIQNAKFKIQNDCSSAKISFRNFC